MCKKNPDYIKIYHLFTVVEQKLYIHKLCVFRCQKSVVVTDCTVQQIVSMFEINIVNDNCIQFLNLQKQTQRCWLILLRGTCLTTWPWSQDDFKGTNLLTYAMYVDFVAKDWFSLKNNTICILFTMYMSLFKTGRTPHILCLIKFGICSQHIWSAGIVSSFSDSTFPCSTE